MKCVTVAEGRREHWVPGVRPGLNRQADEPVGVRHAMPISQAYTGEGLALCGAGVARWEVFLEVLFQGTAPGECRRCAQLANRSVEQV